MNGTLIDRVAELRGVGDAYHDYRGQLQHFTQDTKASILRAMGCPVDDSAALAAELSRLEVSRWQTFLPPIATARGGRVRIDLNIPAREFGASLVWSVTLESGEQRTGVISSADCPESWRGEIAGAWITRRTLELPLEVAPGYHELKIQIAAVVSRCSLIVSPPECFEPPAIVEGRRLWGVAVQLYTVRSRANWGIGDFDDLQQLIRWLAPQGAGFIGLNPLHALAPADPERSSPYSASNRNFLNVMYIAVPAVPELTGCAAALARLAEPQFQERLNQLRTVPLVDYRGVADLKFEVLELLFREFRARHLAAEAVAGADARTAAGREAGTAARTVADTGRAAAYRNFVASGGAGLQLHARFDALDHHLRTTQSTASGWLSWPEEFRDANSAASRHFAATHAEQIEFYVYLQWLAHEQLVNAQQLAREFGMPIGLYGDYAVGSNPSGSETWVDQTSYRMGAEIGAPPDPLALRGQGWGIPPLDPVVLEARQLQGFIRLVRNNMRYYGALRLDHVMSLFRLWWVAAGHSPIQGAYVHYPFHQLLTVLALESARGACLVVGEDLGVVPDEMRRAMPEYGLYHYKVLLFEKDHAGRFRRPDEFVHRALGTVTTHDMPTLRSYWEGLDIELRRGLNLYPSVEIQNDVIREREADRAALLAALQEQGLQPAHPASMSEPFTAELAHALHLYLARAGTRLVSLQIEDLLGMVDPVNVPGTNREYPNWQRKLTLDVEDLMGRADLAAAFSEIGRARAS